LETEEINEDADKFDINFNDSQVPEEDPNFDFVNDTVDPSFVPKNRKDSSEMKEFANLLDPESKHEKPKVNNPPPKNDLFDLNFKPSSSKGDTKKTEHEKQIDAQQEKLNFANEIDPQVSQWSKDPSRGTVKDIRSLLISLKSFLVKFGVNFETIMLSQVMSKGAVRKMYFKVIRKIHPDKTSETDPKILYLFERVSEIITEAFKKHKSMA
jgi:hypothetical protein